MVLLKRSFGRLFPALLMALGVVLLTAGLFAYAPMAIGEVDDTATLEPGDPMLTPPAGAVDTPTPTSDPTATVDPTATPDPLGSPSASPAAPTPSPDVTTDPAPTATGSTPPPAATATPTGGAQPTTRPRGREMATRIVVPSLGIDLPIVPGDLVVPGNRDFYPLCDVAQYMMEFSQPGEPGSTYIYAHARTGMFLPLLEESKRNSGRGMIGALVEVYTSHNRLHLYEIYLVKRHATDLSLVYQLPREGQQVIMQTSEGPRGTIPKLQVAAKPIAIVAASRTDSNPPAKPRACR